MHRSLHFLPVMVTLSAGGAMSQAGEPTFGKVKYGDGREFQTMLYDVRLLGQLPAPGKEPYLVFAGRTCVECDENTSVYIYSPSDGPMILGRPPPRNSYPGNYSSMETGNLESRVRMFIGRCTEATKDVVEWFVHIKLDNGTWQEGVFVSSVEDGKLIGKQIAPPLPKISEARSFVVKKVCREIPPVLKGWSEP